MPTKVKFDVNLFRHPADDECDAIHEAAHRYGPFLGLEPEVVTTGRS